MYFTLYLWVLVDVHECFHPRSVFELVKKLLTIILKTMNKQQNYKNYLKLTYQIQWTLELKKQYKGCLHDFWGRLFTNTSTSTVRIYWLLV